MQMRFLKVLLFVLVLATMGFAQKANTSKLAGTVYDPQGSVVVGAKVTAIATDGKKFQAVTNNEGVYQLTLSYNTYDSTQQFKLSKYDLIVESLGFRRSETKGYAFIPSQFGRMTLDIALEIGPSHDINHP